MGNSEKRLPGSSEIDDELAKDVARLYSWANVEDASYRDFSRERKARHIRPSQSSEGGAREDSSSLEPSAGSQAHIAGSPVAPAANAEKMPSVVQVSAFQVSIDPIPPQPLNSPIAPTRSPFFEPDQAPLAESAAPSLAVYSLAGGVGKTTFCANLGRILCSMREQVLLVDASGSGLLPFYFGATDLRPGLRTFLSPEPHYPPLQVIGADEVTKDWLDGEVKCAMHRGQRTIFDLGPASMSLLSEILGLCGVILIPLLPDLNSILTVSRIEASLKAMKSRGLSIPPAFYIFNRFDDKNPVHEQARGLVYRQCGEHLLPMTIRGGAEIADAIASRMTVADHAPESDAAHDFLEVASWVRKVAPVHLGERSPGRWSER